MIFSKSWWHEMAFFCLFIYRWFSTCIPHWKKTIHWQMQMFVMYMWSPAEHSFVNFTWLELSFRKWSNLLGLFVFCFYYLLRLAALAGPFSFLPLCYSRRTKKLWQCAENAVRSYRPHTECDRRQRIWQRGKKELCHFKRRGLQRRLQRSK